MAKLPYADIRHFLPNKSKKLQTRKLFFRPVQLKDYRTRLKTIDYRRPFRSFCLQAKGLALVAERPCAYKHNFFRKIADLCINIPKFMYKLTKKEAA
jgi:hypothetical protein